MYSLGSQHLSLEMFFERLVSRQFSISIFKNEGNGLVTIKRHHE